MLRLIALFAVINTHLHPEINLDHIGLLLTIINLIDIVYTMCTYK